MRGLLNILWHFPCFGFFSAAIHFLFGSLLVMTGILAPLGLGLIQYSKFLMKPFSSEMISDPRPNTNIAWSGMKIVAVAIYVPFGLLFCIGTLTQMFFLCFTVVGWPLLYILGKSLGTYFNPVNKICVPRAVKKEMEAMDARDYINRKFR